MVKHVLNTEDNLNEPKMLFSFSDILLGWFNNSSEYDIVDFFSLLE